MDKFFDFLMTSLRMTHAENVMIGLLCALGMGLVVSLVYMFKNTYTKSFVMTLVMLPAITQMIILLVNGNVGTGLAIMGAFSLVRFRSVPGSAREIGSLFLAMSLGLFVGSGYVVLGFAFLIVMGLAMILMSLTPFGAPRKEVRELKVSIPESLDYDGLLDDLLDKYCKPWHLERVRTTNMGSLYELTFHITLAKNAKTKDMFDELRCRNGNLPIALGRVSAVKDML
ncbi:MAG: DUF4956 domain-containing protein [Clostridiales bacterium]|nr:DUF4956 domain-containing protein [Clostridiales bacterium]